MLVSSISGGWCGDKRTSNNWLEVDFPQVIGIRGVVIQTPEDVNKGYVKSVQLEIQQRNMNSLVQIGQTFVLMVA
ncbi:hypothetical protein KUTeg_005070 [Tegillarca granosa]|uniref:F5/8 type C domain-containing protein n=1 Tax=Tegillarca granosa TaxID=220873 RepID=A0ABQ9FIQ1_TEGGR|nr:hypothetical protein KUTeg_005070 [Tegillarca granosa]